MYYPFSHQSFYEDCEKNGDNVLKSSGKTVKLTNSNHLKEKQPRNGMLFLLKHVSWLHTTEFIKCLLNPPFYFNKKKNMHKRAVFGFAGPWIS